MKEGTMRFNQWNQEGEDYKTQIEKIEEKLRNAELAVSKVRNF